MTDTQNSNRFRIAASLPITLPLVLFLCSAVVGLWVSYDRSVSWALFWVLLGSIGLCLAIIWTPLSHTSIRRITWILVLIQSTGALYFISQYQHLGYPSKMGFVSRLGELTGAIFPSFWGFQPHPNALATFIEGGVFLAVGLMLSAHDRRERALAALVLAVVGYALLLTASRGAWLAVLACSGLGLILWFRKKHPNQLSKVILISGITAVTAGVMLVLIGPDRVPGLASAISRGVDRGELYNNSLDLIRDYPLSGIGLGKTFDYVYSRYILLIPYVYLTYAHNLALAIWLNHGLLGILSFGWMLFVLFRSVISKERQGLGTPLFWGAVLGFCSMLAHGLTDAPQYGDNYWIMPVFYALLGLSATAASNPTPGFRFPRFKPWAVALAAVSVLTIIAAILVIIPDIYFTNLGAIRHTRADLATFKDKSDRQFVLEQAINDFQRALKTNEHQPTANWRLGLIALDSDQFREAIQHLEIAHSALPHHRGVIKALGYAYLWDGQVDRAAALLASLEEIPQELDYWNWWRREQGQDRLAEYGQELQMRLLQESE